MPEWVPRDRILIKFLFELCLLACARGKNDEKFAFLPFFVDEEKSSAGRGAIRIKIKLLFYLLKSLTWQWRRQFLELDGCVFFLRPPGVLRRHHRMSVQVWSSRLNESKFNFNGRRCHCPCLNSCLASHFTKADTKSDFHSRKTHCIHLVSATSALAINTLATSNAITIIFESRNNHVCLLH